MTAWGIEFDAINIAAEPEAWERLRRLAISSVPATVVREQVIQGWNPAGLAALFGIQYEGVPPLPPRELGERLDEILSMAQSMLERTPDSALTVSHPGRDRNLRDLGFHLFRVAASFLDALEQGELRNAWMEENASPSATGPQLAELGAASRVQLANWFARAPDTEFGEMVETYHGPLTVHALLERTTWHAGQHLRQVWALLEQAGVMIPDSLDSSVFAGLPMPDAIW